MKNKKRNLLIILGVICVLLIAAASWYSIAFNDARFVKMMKLSEYDFRMQDLPMIITGVLVAFYALYLFILFMRVIIEKKRKETLAQSARRINPRLGFLGLLGFLGFAGFWTYSADKSIFPFVFFLFFGFFGFFYEGKMSDTFIDERYQENKIKAQFTADKTALSIIFIATLLISQGKLMGNLDFTLIAFVVAVSLSLALDIFLGKYLLYHYDHVEEPAESEE